MDRRAKLPGLGTPLRELLRLRWASAGSEPEWVRWRTEFLRVVRMCLGRPVTSTPSSLKWMFLQGGGGIGWVEDPPALALAAGRSLHYFLSPGTHRRLMSILIVDKPPWLLWSQEETEEGGSAKRPDGWGSRGTGVRGVCVRSKKGCDRGCLGPRCEGGCLGPRCEGGCLGPRCEAV